MVRITLRTACLVAFLALGADAEAGFTVHVTTFDRELGTLDLETGVYSAIGNLGLGSPIYGMGFGADGLLYGLDSRAGAHLFRIDTATATAVDLGDIGRAIIGAGADPRGTLFALEWASRPDVLSLDPPSGSTTVLGGVDFVGSGLVAVSGDGLIYLSESSFLGGDTLHVFDPSSGTSSVVGATGLDLVAGLFVGDTLYGLSYDNEVYTIDTATGLATFVTSTTLPDDTFFTGVAVIPEPASLWLTATGILGLAAVRGVRHRAARRPRAVAAPDRPR